MSTATWKINKERADIIMGDGADDDFDLNRAWQWNWLLAKATQYEWAAFTPEEYEGYENTLCEKCAVRWVSEGKVEEIELFTYELTEIMYCDSCGTDLGGWDIECAKCERSEWVTEGAMIFDEERYLLCNHDDEYPGDDVKWLCHTCANEALNEQVGYNDTYDTIYSIKDGFTMETSEK